MQSDFHIHLPEETAGLLAHMASLEKKSIDNLLQELTLEALERREDFYFSALAEKLDQDGVKTYSHEEAWK